MTQNNLENIDISKNPDVIDVKDINTFSQIDELTKEKTKEATKEVIQNPSKSLDMAMTSQLKNLKNTKDWENEVPTTQEQREKQSQILNFLGHGSAIAIAKYVEKKYNEKQSIDENFDIITNNIGNYSQINTILEATTETHLKENLTIYQKLRTIQNPPEGSAADIVRKNWVQYSDAIAKLTLGILAEKEKQKKPSPTSVGLQVKKEKDFEWNDNATGASAAAITFLATQKMPAYKSIPLTLLAGLVGKTAQSYYETRDAKTTANNVFNDTAKVIKDGTEFIGEFLTNKNTTTSEKLINGLGSIAIGGATWWAGKKALGWITSLFTSKAKSAASTVKEKIREKIPEESFLGKHWGKLSLLALSAFGLSKLPDGFWGNILNQEGKNLVEKTKKIATDTTITFFDNNTKDIAKQTQSSLTKEQDISIKNKKQRERYINNLRAITNIKNTDPANISFKAKAQEILDEIQTRSTSLSLVESKKSLSSKDFKVLAARASDAGFSVSCTKVSDNNYTLVIGENLMFTNMPQDVVKNNNAIEKTQEYIDKYREEDKATVMKNGMTRLITVIDTYTKSGTLTENSQKTVQEIKTLAKKIKKEIKQNGVSDTTKNLYKQLLKFNAISTAKHGAELKFTVGNEKYTVGTTPDVKDKIFDKYADTINKSTFEIMKHEIANQVDGIATSTMEGLLSHLLSDETYKKTDPVYTLLQEYKANLTKDGEKKAVTPEFILDLGNAILERNKNELNEHDPLAIAVDAGKAYIIFQGQVIWSTVKQSTVNLFWNSYGDGKDEDAIAKGLSPLLLIGGAKLADNIMKGSNPGIIRNTARWVTTKPMVFALYDSPKFLLTKGWEALKGERARTIGKGGMEGVKRTGKFLGNGSARILYQAKHPKLSLVKHKRAIDAQLLKYYKTFDILEDYFKQNYQHQFMRIENDIEILLEQKEFYTDVNGADKKIEKADKKLKKLEDKWNTLRDKAIKKLNKAIKPKQKELDALKDKLDDLIKNQHLYEPHTLDTTKSIKKREIHRLEEEISKMKKDLTPKTFDNALNDVKKSGAFIEEIKAKKIGVEKYLNNINTHINETKQELETAIKELKDTKIDLLSRENKTEVEIQTLETRKKTLQSNIQKLVDQLNFQQENKINALSNDIQRLSEEKTIAKDKAKAIKNELERLLASRTQPTREKNRNIHVKRLELKEAEKYLTKVSTQVEELIHTLENSYFSRKQTKIAILDYKIKEARELYSTHNTPENKSRWENLVNERKELLKSKNPFNKNNLGQLWSKILDGEKKPALKNKLKKITHEIEALVNTNKTLASEVNTLNSTLTNNTNTINTVRIQNNEVIRNIAKLQETKTWQELLLQTLEKEIIELKNSPITELTIQKEIEHLKSQKKPGNVRRKKAKLRSILREIKKLPTNKFLEIKEIKEKEVIFEKRNENILTKEKEIAKITKEYTTISDNLETLTNRKAELDEKLTNLHTKDYEQTEKLKQIKETIKNNNTSILAKRNTKIEIEKEIKKITTLRERAKKTAQEAKDIPKKTYEEINKYIEKLPEETRANAWKHAKTLLKTVGVAGTLYTFSLIEDAKNPYSQTTKEGALLLLFSGAMTTGARTGGVWGGVAGAAIAGLATYIWGEDANKMIDNTFKKLEQKVDKHNLSTEYEDGKLILSSIIDFASISSISFYDLTLGSIFTGDDAFAYFSDTNTEVKNWKLGKYLHRNTTHLKYWNKEKKEEIADLQKEKEEYKKNFDALDESVQETIKNKFKNTESENLLTEQENLDDTDPFYELYNNYLDMKLIEYKIQKIAKQVVEPDSPWINTPVKLFIDTFKTLDKMKAEEKNTVEYFTLLKEFIIRLQTYLNIGMLDTIMQKIADNYPEDKIKGIRLSNSILNFYNSILEDKEKLPQEIIQLLS